MDEPCVVLHQSPVVSISYYSPCISNHIHFHHASQTQLRLLFMGFVKQDTTKGSAYKRSSCVAPNLFLGIMTWLALDDDWVIRYGADMRLWTVPFARSAPAPHVSTWLLSPLLWVFGADPHKLWSWWPLMDTRSSLSVGWRYPRSQFHLLPTDLSNGHLMPLPLARLREYSGHTFSLSRSLSLRSFDVTG